jgi:hypothetical protein
MGVGGGERDNAELAEGAEYAQKRMARVSTTEATEGTKQEQGDYPRTGCVWEELVRLRSSRHPSRMARG